MANSNSSPTSPPPSLPLPCSRSPPKYPDLLGKHRLRVEVQVLEREIGFLEEELQTLDGLQPAYRCCKEVDDFVGRNPDPLLPLNRKTRRSFRIWKWLRSKPCCILSWICCSSGCSFHLPRPTCPCQPAKNCNCCCQCCGCPHRCSCRHHCSCLAHSNCLPCSNCCSCPHRCRCCNVFSFCSLFSCCSLFSFCNLFNCHHLCSCCHLCDCLPKSSCRSCCVLPTLSCPDCSCSCVWSYPKCTKVCIYPKCKKTCFLPCCCLCS